MKIYVAGPYTADSDEKILDNVHTAIDIGIQLIKMGHVPFIPHLTHWVEKRAVRTAQGSIPYEKWLAYDNVWLEYCDAIYVIARSPGADKELLRAVEQGMWVYTRMDQVPYHGELEATQECTHQNGWVYPTVDE